MLVTGGAGFIGSALVRHILANAQARIVNVDKLSYAANPLTLQSFGSGNRHTHVRADICDGAAMARVFADARPDLVIHLAAESHVDRSIDSPAEFIHTNVHGSYVVLEAAARHDRERRAAGKQPLRFVHVSTDEVYGSLETEGQFSEDSSYRPNSPYAASKAAADHLARAWRTTYGLETIVTNCSNNYGPYQFPEKLIPRAIIRALHGQPVEVYGQGLNVRDWLHVDDHVTALWLVAQRGAAGRTYNIGANCECKNIDLVRTLCSILDEALPQSAPHMRLIQFVTDRPGHDLRYAIDASRLRDELGWQPSISLAEGLRGTVRWYLDNKEWWTPVLKESYDTGRLGLAVGL